MKKTNIRKKLPSLKKVNSFSRAQLLVFAIAFALIGYFLVKTFATAPLIATLEAEQMSLPTGGSVINDSLASAGKAIKLTANGTATGSVSFPSSVTSLTVTARGDQCSGSPAMTVSLDGSPLLNNTSVGSTSWTAYSATPANAFNSGTHSLSISLNNFFSATTYKGNSGKIRGTCSRNLYLDVTNFYGPTPAPTPAPTVTLSASPISLTAGQSSTLTWNSTNADSCSASGAWSGPEPTSGSASTGALNQSSTYSLTCTGSGGSATASATVMVTSSSPPPTSGTYGPIAQTCSGTNVTPNMNLPNLVSSSAAGTTFCLAVGTYLLSSSVNLANNDSFIGQPGTIIDGQNSVVYGMSGHSGTTSNGGTPYVTIKSITFRNFTNVAVRPGDNADIENIEAYNNNIGVELNAGDTLKASYIHNNAQYGYDGGPGNNITVDSNEISFNNTGHFDPSNDAGADKIVGSTAGAYGVVYNNNYVHDNYGAGLWSDGNVKATYSNNRIENNLLAGIDHEISWDAKIFNNSLKDNDTGVATGQSCYHNAQIEMNDSSNVEIYSNTIIGDNGANGICISDTTRTETAPFSTAANNNYVHDNTIYLGATASSGLVADNSVTGNRFAANTYYIKSLTGKYWWWPGQTDVVIWSTWQGIGEDTAGVLKTW